jgi:type I restriction enzyme S subunit
MRLPTIPSSWALPCLQDVADVNSGIGFPKEFQGQAHGDLPFYKVGDISYAVANTQGLLKVTAHFVSYAVASQLGGKPVPKGATAFAKIGEAIRLNRRAFVTAPSLIDNNVMSVKAWTNESDRYIHYFLRTVSFSEASRATTVPSLRKGDVEELRVPLAPLPEQKRIADKLDTVLARVDACRERLDRVGPLLKRFRQSVLAAATCGRLTEEWRGCAPPEWETLTLGDLLAEKPRNGYSPKAVDFKTKVMSLTLSATSQGIFRGEHSKYIDEEISPDSHLWLESGDVLVQRANSLEYVGVSAVFNGPAKTFIYPDLMMKCRPNARTTTSFLHILLSAEATRSYFRENATGTAGNMPKINQKTVISAPVKLPPYEEQAEIVRRVEALLGFSDRVEARLTQARAATERLSPAVLAKAFRGELVAQDPHDEPASELLKRLANERSATGAVTKNSRGRKASRLVEGEEESSVAE